MPSRLRETDSDRAKESSRRELSRTEKSDKRERHKLSHRKSSTKDRDKNTERTPSSDPTRRSSMPGMVDSANPPPSGFESKASLPYPTFSKAHSKEAVGTREADRPTLNIFTPDPTDLDAPKGQSPPKRASVRNAPPSPPLTQVDQNTRRPNNGTGKPVAVETVLEEDRKLSRDGKLKVKLQPKPTNSDGYTKSSSEVGSSSSPTKPTPKSSRPHHDISLKSKLPQETSVPQRSSSQPTRTLSPTPSATATETTTNVSSDATSIAPDQPETQRPGSKPPPAFVEDDLFSQVTSVPGGWPSPLRQTPLNVYVVDDRSTKSNTPASNRPPPPPPPPTMPIAIPKVDYLLQNGGLPQNVPKNLLLAGKPMVVQQAAISSAQSPAVVSNLFEPYNQLLSDFEKVVSKNGSLAVATGYRSVARRLLDRLEAVFARDISSEACRCCMCAQGDQHLEDVRGVSWGEILELVSGRRDLPSWPAFSFVASPVGLGISLETQTPMQKLDVDVPEEYRDHYIRQSRKTKQSVDKWLSRQTDSPSSPPEEVDDETLTFAILTHLRHDQRAVFSNLLGIVPGPLEPAKRIPTPQRVAIPQPPAIPQPRVRSESVIIAGLAIERLYRLGTPPRDPETAIFMLNNPNLHNALATLAAVSNDEWDILISGRFDGFLRSGADEAPGLSSSQTRLNTPFQNTASRGTTPAHMNGHARYGGYPSRGSTPAAATAQHGAPITLDEDTEIATLAEIERDIYSGMEALEDAFEALHLKAETVRRALRERAAGLAAAAQRRRGGVGGGIEVRMGTPASGLGGERWETETDDGLGDWDGISELAPDDSASNVSSSRRRRPKRRNERRTPALVEEDDEDAESEGTASPRKR